MMLSLHERPGSISQITKGNPMLGPLPAPGTPMAVKFGQLIDKWTTDRNERLVHARSVLADVPMAPADQVIAACKAILLHSDDDAERQTAGETLALFRGEAA